MYIVNFSFAFLKGTRSGNPIDYLLCGQCTLHLTHEDAKEGNHSKVTWPAFYWSILSANNVKNKYSSKFIWSFIPLVWRSWWYEEIKEQYSTYYQNISLSEPGAIFTDRTGDLNAWNEAMASKKLFIFISVLLH